MSQPLSPSESATNQANNRRVSLRNLYLDPNNFRIIHEQDQQEVAETALKDKVVAQRTLRLLVGDRNQHIQDLIESFKANGYLPVDQIQVRTLSDGGYLVVEGNRRIAALKFLQQERESKGIDLGKLDPDIFSQVPVVLYTDADEMHHLTLMALKHISGNKKWGEWNQAKLLEKMHHTHHLSEDEIRRRIGISTVELRRSLRALALVGQYQASDYGDGFTENKFPIFRQVVRSGELKEWLGWSEDSRRAENVAHRELFFSWLSREPIEVEDADGQAGYGERYLEPVITKRDDIDLLAKIVTDPRAFERLKATRDLNAAYRASDLVFRERQVSAINSVVSDLATLDQLAIEARHLPDLENAHTRLQAMIDRTRSRGLAGVEQNSVFHDRIEQHFTALHIRAFKRFNEFKLSKISRINVFAGINNSGKTTLLEAIYLLARQNDFDGLLEVMRRRGKVAADHLDPEWLLEQLSGEISLSGTFDNQSTQVQIRAFEESDSKLDMSRYLASVEIDAVYDSHRQQSISRIFKGRERETQADGIRLLCPVILSSPFFLNEPHRYARFYHKSTQSKALPIIIKFMREAILPSLRDIRLTDERQRFVVDDEAFAEGVDLAVYGEGLQRVFFLSLLFASAQNGVLLIDEFENALHNQLITHFTRLVDELSRLFNVQVFLTSHSKECIDAFVTGIPSRADLSCHALVDEGGHTVSREFDGATFARLLEAGNVDLRSAQ